MADNFKGNGYKGNGGPSQSPKDKPTDDRDNRKIQSREELQDRTAAGGNRGQGRRNGSDKNR